jgi:protein SCO1/2
MIKKTFLCTLLAACAFVSAAWGAEFRMAAWPQNGASPDLQLPDVKGVTRTLPDYRGKAVVVFFGFLHCPDACPTELYKLSLVMKRLGRDADGVQVLFITLDPQRDDPALLNDYVSGFDERFLGLTGSAAQINRAAADFHVDYARVPTANDYTIDHSTSTFVFDKQGKLRLVGTMKTSAADFAHDLQKLVRE